MFSNARHSRFIITVALLFWATLCISIVSAQTSSPETAGEEAKPVNTICPVTTDEPVNPRFTVLHQGKLIGFCCKKCRRKFEEDPEAYMANLPQFQTVALMQEENKDDGVAGHGDYGDHDHNVGVDDVADDHQDDGDSHEREPPSDLASSGTTVEADKHDHDHDGSRPRIFTWLGKFHPPVTDLPIGMLLGAALAEVFFIFTKRAMFHGASTFCVSIAAAGAVMAATLGWFNGGFALVDQDWVQTTHRWLGTSTALLTLITLGLLINSSRVALPSTLLRYRIALFAATWLVGVTGFFGGALVYGINHYAW